MGLKNYREAVWEGVAEGARDAQFGRRLAFLLSHLKGGEQLLDLGCGEAFFSEELTVRGFPVVGADVAREPLARASRRRPDLSLCHLEAETQLPFPSGRFDVVWASEVLEHVVDAVSLLSEVRRVLAPGGLLLLTTPDHSPVLLLGLALSPRRFAAHFDVRADHLRFYNKRSLKGLLAECGFYEVRVRRRGPVRGPTLYASARRTRW